MMTTTQSQTFLRFTTVGLSAALLLAGCASNPARSQVEPSFAKNVVTAHANGLGSESIDPFDELAPAEFDQHLDRVFSGLRAFCKDRNPCRVVVFAHGGMNTRAGSLDRARRLACLVESEGAYPIFINWRSSLFATLSDHLFKVRQGVFNNKYAVFAPYVVAADELSGLIQAPSTMAAELRHMFSSPAGIDWYRALLKQPDGLHLNNLLAPEGQGARGLLDNRERWIERNITWVDWPLLPLKLAITPLFGQLGAGAWNVMLRRTETIFRSEPEFKGDGSKRAAIRLFVDRLYDEMRSPELKGKVDLSLVGHSMGAIVINGILKSEPRLDVQNIVYMAAAGTVADYTKTVEPYLKAHTATKMYHLVLHPQAERSERNAFNTAPRGSLLVYIDNFLTNPASPAQRTAGRFTNIVGLLQYTSPEIRSRVHFKVFRVGESVDAWNPQKHGEFGDFGFWREAFWNPDTPTDRADPTGANARVMTTPCSAASTN